MYLYDEEVPKEGSVIDEGLLRGHCLIRVSVL